MVVRDIPAVPEGQTRKEKVDDCNRPQKDKIWEELEGYKKNLARAEAVFEKSKATTKPEGTRTTSRTGLLGLCGSKVDSIEYYNEKINETVTKLEAEQKVALSEISNKMLLLSSSRTGLLQHQQLRVYMLK
ncbi:hypothetical protein Ahy_B05g075238 [Arachis hypogaea]|uniref:CSC1/OSCA1-like cytosolic domain-containing protein n=1 Tax=Arachis hypogaea TaxID=3818 RepID=A0A444Z0T9_ARAHY|nr:hypothetical protein Ahy_B05g075238 [Arachis hypogaea]